MALGCVYLATNTVNGKIYIGKSILGMHRRMMTHFAGVRAGYKQPFIYALAKYGKPAFSWVELYSSDDNEALMAAEMALIADYRAAGFILYNATDGGEGVTGRIMSEEQRQGLRDRVYTTEQIERYKASWTPERRAATAERMANRIISEETRRKSSEIRIGKKMTPAAIAKMAATKTGRKGTPWTPERRAKMEAAWAKGCARTSAETRAKISATKQATVRTDEQIAALVEAGRKGAKARWGK